MRSCSSRDRRCPRPRSSAATCDRPSGRPGSGSGSLLGLGVLPAIVFFFAYNQVRFGSPGESGYALATLPPFLERQRALGLFALAHIPMNLDYFLIHLPTLIPTFPFFKPDGLGHVRVHHEPGPAVRDPGGLAPAAVLVARSARRSRS